MARYCFSKVLRPKMPALNVALATLLCGQIAIAPSLVMAQTPVSATPTDSVVPNDQSMPAIPPDMLGPNSGQTDSSAPGYALSQEELAGQTPVPLAKYSFTLTNPATGSPTTISITYGVSHNKVEYDALSAYMQAQLKQNKTEGDKTSLIVSSVTGETNPAISHINPANYGLQPKDVLHIQFDTSRMARFKSWVDESIQKLEENYQRARINALLDKADAAKAKALKEQIKEARRTNSLYGRFLKKFMTARLPFKKSWWKLGSDRNQPTYAYEATFAILRQAGVTAAASYAFMQSGGAIPLPMLGTIISSVAMGAGSGLIMVNGLRYLKWFNRNGIVSNYVIRPVFRTPARAVALLLGRPQSDVKKWDESFAKSVPHRLANEMLKYVSTEIPFVAMPGIIFWLSCHFSLYPDANFAKAPLFATAYVFSKIARSAWQGYLGQGIPDTANSNMLHGLKHNIDDQVVAGMMSPETATFKKEDLNFKSQLVVFGVAMASNGGVVLGMIPHAPAANQLGFEIIKTLTYVGSTGWIYSTFRYDRHFKNFLSRTWVKVRDKLLLDASSNQTSTSCAHLLSFNYDL